MAIAGSEIGTMKTNDVTGRVKRGEVELCIDVGRPGIGTTVENLKKIAMALPGIGWKFRQRRPFATLMKGRKSRRIEKDVRNKTILCITIEGKRSIGDIPMIIEALRRVEKEVDTVFSVGMICRVGEDGTIPAIPILKALGVTVRPNGKTNVGLGRPLSLL